MKVCSKCKSEKPLSDYYKDSYKKDGLSSYCKPCRISASGQWSAANPAKRKQIRDKWAQENPLKVKESSATYRKTNLEKYAGYAKDWYWKNIDKARAMNRASYAASPDKRTAATKAWRDANPDKTRVLNQNYRAKKRISGGKLSHGLADRLYRLQRGKCACCGLPLGDNYHLDHIMPLALGGSNTDDNIQLLRQRCNNQKRAKHPIDFMQMRGFLL